VFLVRILAEPLTRLSPTQEIPTTVEFNLEMADALAASLVERRPSPELALLFDELRDLSQNVTIIHAALLLGRCFEIYRSHDGPLLDAGGAEERRSPRRIEVSSSLRGDGRLGVPKSPEDRIASPYESANEPPWHSHRSPTHCYRHGAASNTVALGRLATEREVGAGRATCRSNVLSSSPGHRIRCPS
jgi:hypothetical protein